MLRTITSSDDFYSAIAERRRSLGMTHEDVEHMVNLTGGHLGKIENGGKPWGKKPLTMTATVPWLLEAYGLSLVLLPTDQLAQVTGMEAQSNLRSHLDKKTRKAHPKGARLSVRIRYRPANV